MRRRINLLPAEYSERRKIQFRSRIFLLGSLLVFITAGGIAWMQNSRVLQYHYWLAIQKQEQSRQLEQWSGLQEYIMQTRRLQEEKKRLEEKSALIIPLLRGQVRWSAQLLRLSRIIPAEVWLTRMKGTFADQLGEIRLEGQALSPAAIARFMVELETYSWVEKVELVSIQKLELDGEKVWEFEILGYLSK